MSTQKVISYKRVSTKSQGDSGLGIEAQESYIQQAVKSNGWELVGEFEDLAVSGSMRPEDRPGMAAAIKMAKDTGAAILAAKVDRFSRDVEDMARLIKLVPLKVATMPHADGFQLHLFAVLAQQERDFIKARTREALAALQARADAGEPEAIAKIARRNATYAIAHQYNPQAKGLATQIQKADEHAQNVRGAVMVAQDEGCKSLAEIAAWLNANTPLRTRRGCEWTAIAVSRIMARNASIKAGKTA
ncbi:recombinase family protein [Salmonella enterica]